MIGAASRARSPIGASYDEPMWALRPRGGAALPSTTMAFGKRMMLVVFLIVAVGLAACVVRTRPAHHHHGRPAAEQHDHKKHKKHKKHHKHRGRDRH